MTEQQRIEAAKFKAELMQKRIDEITAKIDLDYQTWVDLFEICEKYEQVFEYYKIDYGRGLGSNLFVCLLEYYLENEDFQKYYNAPNFCKYVARQVIEQGYTDLFDYTTQLARYISFTERHGKTPDIYTDSLKKSYDIAMNRGI